jgi:hypothetical protein
MARIGVEEAASRWLVVALDDRRCNRWRCIEEGLSVELSVDLQKGVECRELSHVEQAVSYQVTGRPVDHRLEGGEAAIGGYEAANEAPIASRMSTTPSPR